MRELLSIFCVVALSQFLLDGGEAHAQGSLVVQLRVTFNGLPWQAAVVSTSSASKLGRQSSESNEFGLATIADVSPGDHVIEVRDPRLPFVWRQRVRFSPDLSTSDVNFIVDAFAVTIYPESSDAHFVLASDDLVVRVRVPSGSSRQPVLLPIPSGEYRVVAYVGNRLASRVQTIKVGSDGSIHQTHLFLANTAGTLVVLGSDGQPVHRATVTGLSRVGRRIGTGTFSLEGFAPETSVLITAPGFAPSCALFTATYQVVTMKRPTLLKLSVVHILPGQIRGRVEGLGDSNCSVPFSAFRVRNASSVEDQSIIIENFPEHATGRWIRRDQPPIMLTSRKQSNER